MNLHQLSPILVELEPPTLDVSLARELKKHELCYCNDRMKRSPTAALLASRWKPSRLCSR
eukprot:COSAG02_NODE_6344_length_3634_cov_7.830269_2_plen_60_part_00